MKFVFLVLLLLSSFGAFGKRPERFKPIVIPLKAKQIKKMTFHEVMRLRHAYVQFHKQMDKNSKFPEKFEEEKYTHVKLYEFYLKKAVRSIEAHAEEGVDGVLCFYGGWPSVSIATENGEADGVCQPPWKHTDHHLVSGFQNKYSRDSCGDSNHFRCNPALYGKTTSQTKSDYSNGVRNTGVMVNPPNPDAGLCINLRVSESQHDVNNIAERCSTASADQVPNLVDNLRNDVDQNGEDGELWKEFKKMHEDILGENGFCSHLGVTSNVPSFVMANGEGHPACQALKERLDELNILPSEALVLDGEDTVEEEPVISIVSAPNGNIARAVMERCEEEINEADRDRYNRGYASFLSGGLAQCGDVSDDDLNGLQSFDRDLSNVETELNGRDLLLDLNSNNFKQLLDAILIQEYVHQDSLNSDLRGVFDNNGEVNRSGLLREIKEEFPQFARDPAREEELTGLLDGAIERFNQRKTGLPRINPRQYATQIKQQARELNQLCANINRRFNQEFADPDNCWNSWVTTCPGPAAWMEEQRDGIYRSIEGFLARSGTATFLGTDTFRREGLDPNGDFAKDCAENEGHVIFNPNFNTADLTASINEAHDDILKELDDLNDKEGFYHNELAATGNLSVNWGTYEDQIEDYLKNDRGVVLQTLMSSSGEQAKTRAMYMCRQIDEGYTWDAWKRWGSLAGFAGTTVAATAACVFSAGIGCAPAFAVAGAASGALSIGAGTANYIDAQDRADAARRNYATGQTDTRQAMLDEQNANSQRTQGLIEGGTGALSLFGSAFQLARGAGAVDDAVNGTTRALGSGGDIARLPGGAGTTVATRGSTDVATRSTGVVSNFTDEGLSLSSTLPDGTRLLSDGTRLASDGTRTLSNGTRVVDVLEDGTKIVTVLDDGTRIASDGTRILADGTRALEILDDGTRIIEVLEDGTRIIGVLDDGTRIAADGTRIGQNGTRLLGSGSSSAASNLPSTAVRIFRNGQTFSANGARFTIGRPTTFNVAGRSMTGVIDEFGNLTITSGGRTVNAGRFMGSSGDELFDIATDFSAYFGDETVNVMEQIMMSMGRGNAVATTSGGALARTTATANAADDFIDVSFSVVREGASFTQRAAQMGRATVELLKDGAGRITRLVMIPAGREGAIQVNDNTREEGNRNTRDATRGPETRVFTLENLASGNEVTNEGKELFRMVAQVNRLPSSVATSTMEVSSMSQAQARERLNQIYPNEIPWGKPNRMRFVRNNLTQNLSEQSLERVVEISEFISTDPEVNRAFLNMRMNETNLLEALMQKAGMPN